MSSPPSSIGGCWLARFSSKPCHGRLIRAHLIPQQTLKKEIAYCDESVIWDPRVWVWACGGIMGNGSHHNEFDQKKIIVPWLDLPIELLQFADDHGLGWWVAKHFPTIDTRGVGCRSSE